MNILLLIVVLFLLLRPEKGKIIYSSEMVPISVEKVKTSPFLIIAGPLKSQSEVENLTLLLKKEGLSPTVEKTWSEMVLTRVFLGPFPTQDAAERILHVVSGEFEGATIQRTDRGFIATIGAFTKEDELRAVLSTLRAMGFEPNTERVVRKISSYVVKAELNSFLKARNIVNTLKGSGINIELNVVENTR